MSVNYNSAFSFSTKTLSVLLELADSRKYSFKGLAEHTAKLTNTDISAIENTIAMLVDLGIISLSKEKSVLNYKSVKKIKDLILQKIKTDDILELVVLQLKSDSDGQWISAFSLYEGFNGVLGILKFLGIVKQDNQNQRKFWLTEMGTSLFEKNTGMTPEQLKEKLKAQEERGEVAEKFVLAQEFTRLKGHPRQKEVKKISDINVSAGFDLESFQSIDSDEIDKFIEVKSFLGKPRFFWSINEIKVASIKKENYSLYIVDSSKIKEKDYTYYEIVDPYNHFEMKTYLEKIPKNDFEIEPQTYLIKLDSLNI